MQVPIIMPQLGESIAEATIIRLLVKPGDSVRAGQEILEVETNKAVTNVMASYPGQVKQLLVEIQHSYPVGAILGYLDVNDADAARLGVSTRHSVDHGQSPAPSSDVLEDASSPRPAGVSKVEPTVRGLPVPASAVGVSYMSPRMKVRINELGLHSADLAGVAGSGAGGRLTIADFEQFLENLEKRKTKPASSMRIAVADAMRRSWTRPLATVSLPVRLDDLLAHRKICQPKPGPTLYALRSLAIALAENSAPAGRLVGNRIVYPDTIDIAFAVEAEDGVLVPVIRQADRKTLLELTDRYNELVELARKRQLPVDATGGSIATVTNFGTFGLTWATPIPLPEQTLVLGMGAGRTVPNWDAASHQFVPITEANLTLSFDHRVLDGGAAGRLLTRIARLMENPQQL